MIQLDSIIGAVEITWTPPVLNRRTAPTFDHLLGSTSLHGMYSVGVHIRVTARIASTLSTSPSTVPAQVQRRIESSVREILQHAFPKSLYVIQQQPRILASVPCTPHLHKEDASSSLLCFSASFSFESLPHTQASVVERAIYTAITSGDGAQAWTRVVSVKFSQSVRSSFVQAETLVVWQTNVTTSQQLDGRAMVATFNNARTHVTVVTSISTQSQENEHTHLHLISSKDKRWMPTTAVLYRPRHSMPLYANVAVSVQGEGFHRQIYVAIEHFESIVCLQPSIRVEIPLSTHIYVDLDEIRRLERFGRVRLHSMTKHIEIERPSAVSTQHSVVLEYLLTKQQNTQPLVLDFPIHCRYQSPSNSTLYAHATVIAPEINVVCLDANNEVDQVVETKILTSHDAFTEFLDRWMTSLPPQNSGHRLLSLSGHPLQIDDHDQIVIPVGYTLDAALVSGVTLSIAALGALVLVYVATTSCFIKSSSRRSGALWRSPNYKME